jgi:hypothetical protein
MRPDGTYDWTEWVREEIRELWLIADAEQKQELIDVARRAGADAGALVRMADWASSGSPLPPDFLETLGQ